MSAANQFRVAVGAAGNTRYEQYVSLQHARDAASSLILAGDANQVAIETLENGKWVLVRTGKRR